MKHNNTVFLIALCILCSATYAASNDYYDKGREALETMNLVQAIENFQKSIESDPQHCPSHAQLVLAKILDDDFQSALTTAKQGLAACPENADLYAYQGVAQYKLKNLTDAETSLKKAVALKANHTLALAGLGFVTFDQGRMEESLEYHRKAAQSSPKNLIYHTGIALTHSEMGDIGAATESFETAVKEQKLGDTANLTLNLLFDIDKRYSNQIAKYRTRFESDKSDEELSNYLASLYFLNAAFKEASAQYQHTLSINPHNHEAHYHLGAIYLLIKAVDKAYASFRKAYEFDQSNPEYIKMVGIAAGLGGDFNTAVTFLEKSLALNPDDPETHCNYGVFCIYMDRKPIAEEAYKKALALKPDYVDAHLNYGILCGMQDRFEEAVDHFQRAIKLEPENMKARKYLGMTYLEIGRAPDTLTEMEHVLEVWPGDPEVLASYGMALKETGKMEKAVAYLKKSLEIYGSDLEVRYHLGQVYEKLGQKDEAITQYKKTLDLHPKYDKALKALEALSIGSEDLERHIIYIYFSSKNYAEKILARLNSGEKLLKVVEDEMLTPNRAKLKQGEILPEIIEAAKNLKAGELSGIVETKNGYFIIKMVN